MNCCVECFTSSHLKEVIKSFGETGNCSFCETNDVDLIDTKELARFFRNLLDQYKIDEGGKALDSQIENDFPKQIFSQKITRRKELLESILSGESEIYSPILTSNVSLKNSARIQNAHKLWDDFKNEIKNTNRFHIKNALDLEKLRKLFEREEALNKVINPDSVYYRSRLSNKSGFTIAEMRNPPALYATAGRANPKGISYLYLSSDVETTLYEVRSTLYDYVTVGTFNCVSKTKILKLSSFIYDPMSWTENEEIEIFMMYSPFIDKFQEDLSKPIRRSDSEIDYLPTQYLSEFIKSIGFDGVEFQSSLYRNGFNLAVFKPENFICTKVDIYEIEELKLNTKKIE